jgi:hypothetical protein
VAKKEGLESEALKFVGGDEEDRTPDLRIANATLSQLSYVPTLAESLAQRAIESLVSVFVPGA